jgi:hypothetical protein
VIKATGAIQDSCLKKAPTQDYKSKPIASYLAEREEREKSEESDELFYTSFDTVVSKISIQSTKRSTNELCNGYRKSETMSQN